MPVQPLLLHAERDPLVQRFVRGEEATAARAEIKVVLDLLPRGLRLPNGGDESQVFGILGAMHRGELELRREHFTDVAHEHVAIDGLQLGEVAGHDEDGPLRQLLDVAKEGLEDFLLEHRNLVEKDDVEQLQARRRIALRALAIALPAETKSGVDRVHENALGVRQAIQIGVHESTGRRQEENATSQIHDELRDMHKDFRLAGARSAAQEAATLLHVGMQVPDAVDGHLLPDEVEEASLVAGPLGRIPKRPAANDGAPQAAIKNTRHKNSKPRNSTRSIRRPSHRKCFK